MQQLLHFICGNSWLALVWLLLFCLTAITFMKSRFSSIQVVDNQRAIQLINQEKAEIWDVRSQEIFNQGHLAHARHINFDAIKTRQLAALTQDKARSIILISEDGVQAMAVAKLLYQQGFQQAFVLRDGIIGWNREQLPLTIQKEKRQPPLVELYTRADRPNCPYCARAKALLAQYDAIVREIVIKDADDNKLQEMVSRSGRTTVPQIFIRKQHIGGCDDLVELDSKQLLAALLS
ncbi:MAG: glutaredoxin 3 [Candidatus Symbiodolus clandestinus]